MAPPKLKFIKLLMVLLSYYMVGGIYRIFFFWNLRIRYRLLAWHLSFYNKFLVHPLLGIKLQVEGKIPSQGNFLIISNHLSYVDVLILASLLPSNFVTSKETEETLGLGHLCAAGGSIFVERRKRTSVSSDLSYLVRLLKTGLTITIFPEGTSSNGDTVLPFKPALIACAKEAGTPLLPICIRYLSADGKPLDSTTRDSIYYYGDMEFYPHMCRLLNLTEVKAEVKVFDPIPVEGRDRKELANTAYAQIVKAYQGSGETSLP